MPQISNPTAELVILIGKTDEQAKAEIEANPVTAEAKISNLKMHKSFCVSI